MQRKNKMRPDNQLGFQAPKGRRLHSGFMSIEVKDMHYCSSHDFWFNTDEQKEQLHLGKPCIYTDGYEEGRYNHYGEGSMLWARRNGGFTLKKAIRLIKKTRNLPVGTIVNIVHNCYGIGRKSKESFSLAYKYKVKKENRFEPDYKLTRPSLTRNFETDLKANELTTLLRANGFIVKIFVDALGAEEATAYGHGLRVGYSANENDFNGYYHGTKSILFERWDYFNKWSQCRDIPKTTSNEEVLQILLNVKNEVEED